MVTNVAVVTGHSRGLGAAVAAELAQRGVAVLGVARGGNPSLAAHAALVRQVALDLGDESATLAWLAGDALPHFVGGARQALLVNNAGLLQPVGPLPVQQPAAVARAVAVNVGAVLALSAAFATATHAVADRRILHVSSGAARHAYAGWSVYCATKAALDQHARAVALDATPGLRIASVAPGVIDTDMQEEIRGTTSDRFPDRDRFVQMQREDMLRSPQDAARALVDHLLSPDFGREPVTETRR